MVNIYLPSRLVIIIIKMYLPSTPYYRIIISSMHTLIGENNLKLLWCKIIDI